MIKFSLLSSSSRSLDHPPIFVPSNHRLLSQINNFCKLFSEYKMPLRKKNDGRREIGAQVQAKAIAVTSASECKRLYGTLWKSQMVTGTVKRVVTPPAGSGKQTSLVCNWIISSVTKTKEVKLVSVTLPEDCRGNTNSHSMEATEVSGMSLPQNSSAILHSASHEQDTSAGRTTGETSPATTQSAVFVTSHGTHWIPRDIRLPLNGSVPRKYWAVSNVAGMRVSEDQGINDMTPLSYFQWMFPMSYLGAIVTLTNQELSRRGKNVTTATEILRFFGVLVLLSWYEFGPRRGLWSATSPYKYIAAPNFTRIMPSHRFEILRSCLRFSSAGGTSDSENCNRWALVDDFVKAINEHREMFVTPSELICVDESMSRWYGLGGDWIDVGLPTYRAIDRKPENGCEIKTSACGRSGIILRLEIVKSPTNDAQNDEDAGMSHGTALTCRLTGPWAYTNRIVCADSYFASVETARVLFEKGTRFIGVVKTAHRGFPLAHLGATPMEGRGKWSSMVHGNASSKPEIGAVLWVDRERRYFVTTTGTTLPGSSIYRERWRRVGNESRRTTTETQIPSIAETYYMAASQIDRHNRCRQDDLKLEKKFLVKEWSQRVNTSLLAICIVDAWLLYKGDRGSRGTMTPNDFYSTLAEELVDSTYMIPGTRSTTARSTTTDVTSSGIGPHLTPTTRKRKRADGSVTNQCYQGHCRICKTIKTKYTCSECTSTFAQDYWICHRATGRQCFTDHLAQHHFL